VISTVTQYWPRSKRGPLARLELGAERAAVFSLNAPAGISTVVFTAANGAERAAPVVAIRRLTLEAAED